MLVGFKIEQPKMTQLCALCGPVCQFKTTDKRRTGMRKEDTEDRQTMGLVV